MAGAAQADRAGRDARGGPSGSRHIRRDRPVLRHPIRGAVAAFARSPNGGLILTGSGLANVHRELIITLAARHRLPAVYSASFFVTGGGLISYSPDRIDQFRRAAS